MARSCSSAVLLFSALYAGALSVASCLDVLLPAFTAISLLPRYHAAPKQPLYGWCKSKGCKMPAQSGYDYKGYCKSCFGEKFPKKAIEMRQSRKKACELCEAVSELRYGGVCKPCWRAHGCDPEAKTCKWINKEPGATRCTRCLAAKSTTTAKQVRLAMRCPLHTTPEQRSGDLCSQCFSKSVQQRQCAQDVSNI